MRNGRMVVLVDAEDRENEGDLVIPAQMATPDAINFMAARPRPDLPDADRRARSELQLEAMVGRNRSRNRTAFTQSIEAREGISTGISAPTARAPSPPPSTRPRAPPTSSRPATSSRWSRARAAC